MNDPSPKVAKTAGLTRKGRGIPSLSWNLTQVVRRRDRCCPAKTLNRPINGRIRGKSDAGTSRSFAEPLGPMVASMLIMASQIELYKQMSILSARMVQAARASDWDSLIDLERNVAVLRDAVQASAELDPAAIESGEKRRLVQSILENDAEVRRHTEPWMEQVRVFLGQGHQQPDLDRPFGDLSIISARSH